MAHLGYAMTVAEWSAFGKAVEKMLWACAPVADPGAKGG
jgi:hypothetical protein